MRYNFRLFESRLREACKARRVSVEELGSGIGLGPRRIIDLERRGAASLDVYRLAQMAEKLDVTMDWLCGAE